MLAVQDVVRIFPGRPGSAPLRALDRISLDVMLGEFFALLGPSGCGKTTLLQSIAGLETPDEGRISLAGEPVFDAAAGTLVPANRRAIGMVFQSYAIWPHMTVFANVAFPLVHGQRPRPATSEVRKRVLEALSVVKLADFADRPAPHLSGGQQQRVALARAIVARPRLLLLDEPLSNLDARLRDAMRIELRQLVKELGITTVFVTHDQVEAMGMADRIALMRDGRLVDLGTPDEVYFRPRDAFSAGFMGQGNVLAGTIATRGSERVILTAAGAFPADVDATALPDGASATAILRPHVFEPVDAEARDEVGIIKGAVQRESLLGTCRELEIAAGAARLRVNVNAHDMRRAGSAISLRVPRGRCIVLPGPPSPEDVVS